MDVHVLLQGENMNATFTWPKTIKPFDDESLSGFLNRFARVNGLTSRRQLLSAIGFPEALHVSDDDLSKLSKLLNVEFELLRVIAWHENPVKSVLRQSMIRSNGEAICPECVSDSNYSRQLWTHRMATCCPEHERRLREKCGVCGSSLRHDRLQPSHCNCGADS